MKIGGIHKFTLIDYPGKMACTIFTLGCNLRCGFCHNASLVLPEKMDSPLEIDEIASFLKKRQDQLDGVVISGGEPLMQSNIFDFLAYIKELGYSVKIDTNGCFPKKLHHLIDEGLIDYIAMDIKNVFSKYNKTCGVTVNSDDIKQSIKIIKESNLPHHFRTTFYKPEMTEKDLQTIKEEIIPKGSEFKIQEFKESNNLIKDFM